MGIEEKEVFLFWVYPFIRSDLLAFYPMEIWDEVVFLLNEVTERTSMCNGCKRIGLSWPL